MALIRDRDNKQESIYTCQFEIYFGTLEIMMNQDNPTKGFIISSDETFYLSGYTLISSLIQSSLI